MSPYLPSEKIIRINSPATSPLAAASKQLAGGGKHSLAGSELSAFCNAGLSCCKGLSPWLQNPSVGKETQNAEIVHLLASY